MLIEHDQSTDRLSAAGEVQHQQDATQDVQREAEPDPATVERPPLGRSASHLPLREANLRKPHEDSPKRRGKQEEQEVKDTEFPL